MSLRDVRRRRVVQGAGVGAAGLLAGCLGGGDGNGDSGNGDAGNGDAGSEAGDEDTPAGNDSPIHILTDYSGEEHWNPYWEEELVPAWEEERDIPIDLEYAGFQGPSEQRLSTLMQSGEPPEIYHGAITEVADLVNQGLTMQVDDVVDDLEDEWGETLYKFTLQPFNEEERRDETHVVPHGIYAGGTFNYRADIYAELGLEEPETWQEIVDNARAIDESDFEAAGWALPGQPIGKSGSDFSNWLYNSGGAPFQWSDGEYSEPELWFDEEHVMPVLDVLQELAEFSPDPSGISWGDTITQWVQGRIGQCFMNNAWLCGPAVGVSEDLGMATEQALIPTREGVSDPPARGWVLIDGTPVIEGSSNPDGAKDFLRFMYGPDRRVEVTLLEPMRFLPPYDAVLEADAYQNAEFFSGEVGQAMMEKNRYVADEIVPEMYGPGDIATSPETLHVGRFNIQSELTNRVVVEGQDPERAYEWAYGQYERRYEETRQMADY